MKTDAEIRQTALEIQRRHAARLGEGLLHRTVELEIDREELAKRSGTDAAHALIPISLSSEAPIPRYDFWNDETYDEILVHTVDAVDLSRAGGMPFLVDHNGREYDAHMGTIENVRLDPSTRKLRGDVRFSRRPAAQELRGDMLDGIRSKISVGYRVDPAHADIWRPGKGESGRMRITYKRWTPMEGSSVAIPADESVGVGRGLDGSWEPADVRALRAHIQEMEHTPTAAPKAQERSVPDTTAAAPANNGAAPAAGDAGAAAHTAPDLKVVRGEVREEIKRITELARSNKMTDELPKWLEQGLDEKAVRDAILEVYRTNQAKAVANPTAVELSARERKQYSLRRGVETLVNAIDGRRSETQSFETEVSDDLAKRLPDNYKRMGGLLVPICTDPETARFHNMANEHGLYLRRSMGPAMDAEKVRMMIRAGLDSATSTKGAELKFTVPGEFLELLRNFMVAYAAGTSYLTGLQGPIAFPNQNGAATATWVGENPGSDVSDSNLTLQQITLAPKTIQASTSYSRQLWIQSIVDVDGLVKQDLAAINAIALDLAVLNGTGSSNQPTGILAASGTNSYVMGTNGATPTYNDLVGMETLIAAANADQWPLSYIVHPTTRGTFKKATVLSNTVGLPAWTVSPAGAAGEPSLQAGGGSRKKGELNGYDAWATAQIPNNLTKGTSSGICLAGILGAFSQCVVGDWGMFEIIVDPYRLKKQGMIELTSFAMYGIAVKYPAAFTVVKDLLA